MQNLFDVYDRNAIYTMHILIQNCLNVFCVTWLVMLTLTRTCLALYYCIKNSCNCTSLFKYGYDL